MRRRIALVVAAFCAVGAVVLAVLPYTGSSQVEVPDASNEAPDADGNFLNLIRITTVQGRCRPPVISAWRKDGPDDEGLWAVTVGTNMMGYAKANSMGRLCAHSARRRLAGSLGLGVLGVGAVLIGRRIQPPAAPPPAAPPGPCAL
jgi:hypothetical protein